LSLSNPNLLATPKGLSRIGLCRYDEACLRIKGHAMKSVVVTGASTGIGWSCAQILLAGGFRVFGGVRKQADADRLAKEFGQSFVPLIFDVTDAASVAEAADKVRAALGGETLFGLVNNAGIAVPGPLLELSIDDFRRQIDVNLVGQLIVTQAFAPLTGVDRSLKGPPGRIVMISSVSGKTAFPFAGAYAASKFGLEGMSEALRRELMMFGVEVIVVAPGNVATPIWDKSAAIGDGRRGNSPYAAALQRVKRYALETGKKGLAPERIGALVKTALTVAKPKARYTLVPDPITTLITRRFPKRIVDKLIANQLGLKKA
jgi:NAD(P)-dependent dehydrogenase (short-subunit alcohol dehydrogenase family)